MAPEVLLHHDHSYQADFYAVGVIAYELLMGKRPYIGSSRKEIRDKVINTKVTLDPDVAGVNDECADFINKMLERRNNQRLGYNGIDQVFSHPWMACSDTE